MDDSGGSNCPVDMKSLEPDRHTHVSWRNGGKQDLVDTWTAAPSRRVLAQSWTGETVFFIRQSQEQRRVSFIDELQSCEE